jgi:hypothetical protein
MSGLSFAPDKTMALEREIETYRQKLPELLSNSKGKLVVIHGDDVIGIYTSLDDALKAGYEHVGGEAFLVREISDTQEVLTASRSLRPCRSSKAP